MLKSLGILGVDHEASAGNAVDKASVPQRATDSEINVVSPALVHRSKCDRDTVLIGDHFQEDPVPHPSMTDAGLDAEDLRSPTKLLANGQRVG
jgi:hypothetical protein